MWAYGHENDDKKSDVQIQYSQKDTRTLGRQITKKHREKKRRCGRSHMLVASMPEGLMRMSDTQSRRLNVETVK